MVGIVFTFDYTLRHILLGSRSYTCPGGDIVFTAQYMVKSARCAPIEEAIKSPLGLLGRLELVVSRDARNFSAYTDGLECLGSVH